MGGQVSKIMGKIFGSKEMRLLMLGLDAAGKTSKSFPLQCAYSLLQSILRTLLIHCDSYPLQAQTKPRCHNDPYSRLQR